jgi:pimeloyl-ACP methyl ester carboxylesterase
MTNHATSPTHRQQGRVRRTIPFALRTISLAAVAALCAGRTGELQAASTTPPTPPTPPATANPGPARPTGLRDELVAVDGVRMHVRCDGAGSATVVLIAGFESTSDTWSVVAPALAERTRVCTYDRPGLGGSDPANTATASFAAQADDLHVLLSTAGEPGPYIVVGHSFGGVAAIEFAEQRADDVDALVLVDASPIHWPTTLCAIADDGTGAAAFIRAMCTGWTDPFANAEHLDVFAAFDDASAPPVLRSLPVTIITAVDRELPPDITDAERTRLTAAWDRGQLQWAQLGTDSRLITVPDTGHLIQLDQPAVVIDEIERLLP